MQKNIYMIGGPNGAGKTTSAVVLMPEIIDCDEYVNADAIAASLSPFYPERSAIQAGRLMISRLKDLSISNSSFAFETTLAAKSFAPFLNECKNRDYQLTVLYLWLVTPELALNRVKYRVKSGGHNIPDDVVVRRYHRSMSNLINLYMPIADRWVVYDNSMLAPKVIAEKRLRDKQIQVHQESSWHQFTELKQS